jgi:3-hydroxyacyl-[acyl-carrier-protein] dehydratase
MTAAADLRSAPPALMPMERAEVQRLMPHAPEWVQVDRVLECSAGRIRTEKRVGLWDPNVAGHFRGSPALLPGALLLEYIGQSAYLLERLTSGDAAPVLMLARCNAVFLSPARAGDVLTAEVSAAERVGGVAIFNGVVRCGDRPVCRAKIFTAPPSPETIALLDRGTAEDGRI